MSTESIVLKNNPDFAIPDEGLNLLKLIELFQRAVIIAALRRTSDNQTKAAQLIGLKLSTLNSIIHKREIRMRESEIYVLKSGRFQLQLPSPLLPEQGLDFMAESTALERGILEQAWEKGGKDLAAVSKLTGLSESKLFTRMSKLGLVVDDTTELGKDLKDDLKNDIEVKNFKASGLSLDDHVKRYKSKLIKWALLDSGGNVARASRLLGMRSHQRLQGLLKSKKYKHLQVYLKPGQTKT